MTALAYNSATDAEIVAAIGKRLRALRKARGLTQDRAAARAGLARSTVSDAEHGRNPTLHTLVRLLRVYEDLAALEGFSPEPEAAARRGGGGSDAASRRAGRP